MYSLQERNMDYSLYSGANSVVTGTRVQNLELLLPVQNLSYHCAQCVYSGSKNHTFPSILLGG